MALGQMPPEMSGQERPLEGSIWAVASAEDTGQVGLQDREF